VRIACSFRLRRRLTAAEPYATLVAGRCWQKPGKGNVMTWTTPILIEICLGLEINGYLPAEF
jgi:coenzyme PQQ precursor peptide PqqA